MGLDCSHDAFSGAYSSFNRFRQAIAKAIGGSYPPHEDKDLNPDYFYWDEKDGIQNHPGLYLFFSHSDCDGEIEPLDCLTIAEEMELLLPKLDEMGIGHGHIAARGGYGKVARKFINGCREAHKNNEPLIFG